MCCKPLRTTLFNSLEKQIPQRLGKRGGKGPVKEGKVMLDFISLLPIAERIISLFRNSSLCKLSYNLP